MNPCHFCTSQFLLFLVGSTFFTYQKDLQFIRLHLWVVTHQGPTKLLLTYITMVYGPPRSSLARDRSSENRRSLIPNKFIGSFTPLRLPTTPSRPRRHILSKSSNIRLFDDEYLAYVSRCNLLHTQPLVECPLNSTQDLEVLLFKLYLKESSWVNWWERRGQGGTYRLDPKIRPLHTFSYNSEASTEL